MPFINEQLADNQAQNDQAKLRKLAARRSRFRFDPESVMSLLRQRILAQDPVLNSLEDMLYTLKADFGAPDRPLVVNLLLGPTGVGKTETVRVLSEAILGSADQVCRIDMNTLAQEHYSAAITGSPPGYVGSKEGQTLFDEEKIKGSYSRPGIVLFDEIEKADRQVVRAIMNILDTGKLTLSAGNKVIDFSNAMIFMTSNLGVEALASKHALDKKTTARAFYRKLLNKHRSDQAILDQALRAHFDLEFINRIDRILTFAWIGKTRIVDLVTLELAQLNQRLSKKQLHLSCSNDLVAYLAEEYNSDYGVRDLRRHLRRLLEPKLARAILTDESEELFYARLEGGQILIEAAQ